MVSAPLIPGNTAIVFLDHQRGLLELSRTVPVGELRQTGMWLAKLARLLHLPVIISTAMLETPAQITPELLDTLGGLAHHASGRTTANAFTHAPTAEKIVGVGRKTLLVAGVLTEVAVHNTALSATERGYAVQVVSDACGGLSARTEDAAFRRLAQAGVATTSCASVTGQLMGDITEGEGSSALKILFEIASPLR